MSVSLTHDPRQGRFRFTDPSTSKEGAVSVAFRSGTQKAKLLEVFLTALNGLTDEQAAERAGLLRSTYWKRCSELRQDGLISPTGETRVGDAGVSRMVSVITEEGRDACLSLLGA